MVNETTTTALGGTRKDKTVEEDDQVARTTKKVKTQMNEGE